MSKGILYQELPHEIEKLVKKVCGRQWKSLPDVEKEGAFGVAIVKSLIDGVRPTLSDVASHLGLREELLSRPWRNLSLNGFFLQNRINNDRQALERDDMLAWCYYAGYASGMIGPWDRR